MIKDFRLEKGMQANQLKEEVMRLVKQINIHILKQTVDVQTLTFEGFGHFLL
jgi:nucleoid DNA-binding protein